METGDEEKPKKNLGGRPKSTNKMLRVAYHLDRALIARIDAYWHARGLPSRAVTIRKLIEHGLGGP